MAKTKPKQGREERKRERTARVRLPDLSRRYEKELTEIRPGDFEFQLSVRSSRRLRGSPWVSIDRAVEAFDWQEDKSVISGSLSLRRPDVRRPRTLVIGNGQQVRCRVRWHGRWYSLWTMRASFPDVDEGEGSVAVELTDDLDALSRNKRRWRWRTTKRRKKVWKAHQIARAVARREGLRVGQLAQGVAPIRRLEMTSSALDVLKAIYMRERRKTGRNFVIRRRNGLLEVVPFGRNRVIYVLRGEALSRSFQQTGRAHPVTAIEATAHIGRGKVARKVKHTEFRRPVVQRLGYIAKEKDYGRVESRAELRRLCLRDLETELRVRRTGQFAFPGIPFIRRGDTMRVITEEPGWSGRERELSRDRSYVYVRSVSHSVSPGEYVTEVDAGQQDPYRKDEERQDREAREKARKRRKARRRDDDDEEDAS